MSILKFQFSKRREPDLIVTCVGNQGIWMYLQYSRHICSTCKNIRVENAPKNQRPTIFQQFSYTYLKPKGESWENICR